MHRRTFLGLGAGGLALLAGCETAETADTPEALAAARQRTDRATVFGRLRWIENGEERRIEQSMFGWSVTPRLRRLGDGAVMNTEIDPGGHFVWSLPAGAYRIDRINYRDPWSGNYFVSPGVTFRAPENGRTYYVGTLRVEARTERGFLGTMGGAARFTVENRLAEEQAYLRGKLGTDIASVETALMG